MSIDNEIDLNKWRKEEPASILRQAAKAYLFTALKLYIDIEAKVSIWSDKLFGASADIISSLNRATNLGQANVLSSALCSTGSSKEDK